jgi:hypothetical protein
MDELVAQYVIRGFDGAREGQDDSAFVGLGDTARAFAELAFDSIGLPEVRAARIQNERLAAAKVVVQDL